MNKEDILKILEGAKDKNGDVPMRLVRQAFEKLPEPCTGTISRQAAIDTLLKEVRLVDGYYVENDEVIDKDDAVEAIRLLPSVTPKRKTGRWIEEQRGIKVTQYKCSECGRTVIDDTTYDVAEDYPFCHCGADMRQREESK